MPTAYPQLLIRLIDESFNCYFQLRPFELGLLSIAYTHYKH